MGNGDHRAPEGADILLQPFGGVEVQVVGGLVQQQNVRVLQDQSSQVHPGLFPAGEAVKQLGRISREMDRPAAILLTATSVS